MPHVSGWVIHTWCFHQTTRDVSEMIFKVVLIKACHSSLSSLRKVFFDNWSSNSHILPFATVNCGNWNFTHFFIDARRTWRFCRWKLFRVTWLHVKQIGGLGLVWQPSDMLGLKGIVLGFCNQRCRSHYSLGVQKWGMFFIIDFSWGCKLITMKTGLCFSYINHFFKCD